MTITLREPTLIELVRSLDDYLAGPPPWVGEEALEIDAAVCRAAECPRCEAHGLNFHPFHRAIPRLSYRALAVCSCCGWATEL